MGVRGGSDSKESDCKAGDLGSIPGLGRSPRGGHGKQLQYSCLENPQGQRSLAGASPWSLRVARGWAGKHSPANCNTHPSDRITWLTAHEFIVLHRYLFSLSLSNINGLHSIPPRISRLRVQRILEMALLYLKKKKKGWLYFNSISRSHRLC